MPEIIPIDPLRPDPELLTRTAWVLAGGGLAALPTETFYGLAASVNSPTGLLRLVQLKGREKHKPFPLILGELDQMDQLIAQIPPKAQGLMARCWPGPLTLVLPARKGLNPLVVSPGGGVGVRLSPHAVATGLALALGGAITATSANLAGQPPAARIDQIDPRILEGLDLVLDGGPCPGGLASTVLDCCQDPPKVLRAGAVGPEELS